MPVMWAPSTIGETFCTIATAGEHPQMFHRRRCLGMFPRRSWSKLFPRRLRHSDGETFPCQSDGETFPIAATGKHYRMFPRRPRPDGETFREFWVSGGKCFPVAVQRTTFPRRPRWEMTVGKCFPDGPIAIFGATGKHNGNVSPSLRQRDGETSVFGSDGETFVGQPGLRGNIYHLNVSPSGPSHGECFPVGLIFQN